MANPTLKPAAGLGSCRRPGAYHLCMMVLLAGLFASHLADAIRRGDPLSPPDLIRSEWKTGIDYQNLYAAANSLRAGLSIYTDNRQHGERFYNPLAPPGSTLYVYPPLGAYVFVPFSFLPPRASYLVWCLCQIALVFLIMETMREFLGSRLRAWWFGLLFLNSQPMLFALGRGNFDMLPVALLALAFYLWRKEKHPYFVGLCIAFASALKLYPFIFVGFFFLKRQWKIAGSGLVFTMLIFSLVGVRFLPEYGEQFVKLMGMVSQHLYAANHSSLAFCLRLCSLGEASEASLSFFMGLANVINLVLLLAIAAGSWFLKIQDRNLGMLEACLYMLVMTLVPAVSYDYNLLFILIIGPVLIHFSERDLQKSGPVRIQAILAFVCLAQLLAKTWWLVGTPTRLIPLLAASKFPAIVTLWALLALLLVRITRAKSQPSLGVRQSLAAAPARHAGGRDSVEP